MRIQQLPRQRRRVSIAALLSPASTNLAVGSKRKNRHCLAFVPVQAGHVFLPIQMEVGYPKRVDDTSNPLGEEVTLGGLDLEPPQEPSVAKGGRDADQKEAVSRAPGLQEHL